MLTDWLKTIVDAAGAACRYRRAVPSVEGAFFTLIVQRPANHHLRTFTGRFVMLRMSAIAALVLLQTSAFAQQTEAIKGIKFGAGCLGRVSTLGPRFGTCEIVGSKTRIWCPNGEIFDRVGTPQSYLVRSICNLNQVLD
jgi:hypothetical protein